ncbi:hypothetical protein [Ferrovibrio sp.]|uniref:hypothetical protein n=1 Tax=Ferrovibrio sp. TaxID=1917215 RepID=UPI00263415C4|nr:hypothetical protein [Ferrovibrio sp.]
MTKEHSSSPTLEIIRIDNPGDLIAARIVYQDSSGLILKRPLQDVVDERVAADATLATEQDTAAEVIDDGDDDIVAILPVAPEMAETDDDIVEVKPA